MSDTPSFREQAACASPDVPAKIFYETEIVDEETGDFLGVRFPHRAAAERICDGCPVMDECRLSALREPAGIWGKLDYRERSALARRIDAHKAGRMNYQDTVRIRERGAPAGPTELLKNKPSTQRV